MRLFEGLKDSIVQVRVIEQHSGTKSTIGSGFRFGEQKRIITNYHVVSAYVFDAERYSVDIIRSDGKTIPATVEQIDVVHDLAVLRPSEDSSTATSLRIAAGPLRKGEKVFALGNPHDLGLAIVEGTYNGEIEESLYQRIHFTGSLNGGMSGGPAVLADGSLIGVNVSTQGDQVSFLVPASFVAGVDAKPGVTSIDAIVTDVREQLLRNQAHYIAETLKNDVSTIPLGDFTVPGRLSKAFRCWSKVDQAAYRPYSQTTQSCSTEDELYVNESLTTGSISLRHIFLDAPQLNVLQFSSLVEQYVKNYDPGYYSSLGHITAYECETSVITTGSIPFSASICLRRYKKLSGLYDGAVILATLPKTSRGLISALSLSGVSPESFRSAADKFIRSIKWKTESS